MRLAVVGSYNEACGVASYVAAIKNSFGKPFEVEVMNLKTTALVGNEALHNSEAAEAHIESICDQLENFDCVNLQLEWGIYGRRFDIIARRLIKLIKASKRIILTIHSLHITNDSRDAQQAVFQTLKSRPADRPYWFVTHLAKEADSLRRNFGIDNVDDFPVAYFSEQEVKNIYAQTDAKAWKVKLGFKEDDIVLLHAGFFAAHKDHMTPLKALQLLPQNYKLVFSGSEHPAGIQMFSISPVVTKITDYIDRYDEEALKIRNHSNQNSVPTLGDRVRFIGSLSEEDLPKAMVCADFVTITHLETGQSSSGIASMALQLERPVIVSYNRFFMEYEKYYKDGYSYSTMGNHYELRDKILNFDRAQLQKLHECGKIYSMDGLARLYQKIYDDMLAGRVVNAGREAGAPAVAAIVAPPPPPTQAPAATAMSPAVNPASPRQQEVNRVIYEALWRLIVLARRIRTSVGTKRERFSELKRKLTKRFA